MTKQDDYVSVVVKRRPGYRRRRIAVGVLALLVVGIGAFVFGGAITGNTLREVAAERDRLANELAAVRQRNEQLRQQLTNLQLGAEVDRQSVEDVRQLVKTQEQKLAELREEITFYKGLMAPTERERGLSVRGWELYQTASPQRFKYKLTVQQLAVKHRLLSGYVNVDIVGRYTELDEEQTFSLHEISEQQGTRNIKLRFKYFQHIEGELVLPDGFQPRRVDLVVRASKPKQARIEKHFSWIVQEM